MHNYLSYWEETSFYRGYDVIIIGSGIVGLSAAYHLKSKHPALKVGILEAGFLPSGASTKNAGFACFGSISEMIDDLTDASQDEVLQVVEARWKGLEKLKSLLGEQAIDYQKLGGYEIFKDNDQQSADLCIEAIPRFNKLFKEITGHADIYSVSSAKITDFGFKQVKSMIINRCEAQIDTGKMMLSLLTLVKKQGVSVFNNCKVQQVRKQDPKCLVQTNQGSFETNKIIYATNAFTGEFYPELIIEPGRGQILVTAEIPGLKVKGAFHYDKGYYYFRNINNRILLGGGRNLDFEAEKTLEHGITVEIQSALETLLYETIIPGQQPTIEYRWSGVMAFGKELKPIIKKLEDDIYCAVRCNGMGVAIGSLSGEQVADLVLTDL